MGAMNEFLQLNNPSHYHPYATNRPPICTYIPSATIFDLLNFVVLDTGRALGATMVAVGHGTSLIIFEKWRGGSSSSLLITLHWFGILKIGIWKLQDTKANKFQPSPPNDLQEAKRK
ncbi:hypothetical protein AAMO2058_001177800 [Amorphochlora amoebiformis]